MTAKNFFTVEGIVCLLFGLGFLLAPNIITALYDETKLGLNPLGDLYARCSKQYGLVISPSCRSFSILGREFAFKRKRVGIGVSL